MSKKPKPTERPKPDITDVMSGKEKMLYQYIKGEIKLDEIPEGFREEFEYILKLGGGL